MPTPIARYFDGATLPLTCPRCNVTERYTLGWLREHHTLTYRCPTCRAPCRIEAADALDEIDRYLSHYAEALSAKKPLPQLDLSSRITLTLGKVTGETQKP